MKRASEEVMRAYQEGYNTALGEMRFDRAAIIEECARVIEKAEDDDQWTWSYPEFAAAIRALKDGA